LSSFLLTLSVVCPLFFWPFRLFVHFSNNRKGQKKSGQTTERVKRKEDKQSKGLKEKRTNNRKGQKKRGQTILSIVCPLFFWPFRWLVLFFVDPFDCLSSFLLTLSIVCPLFFWPFRLFVLFSFNP
jgi:hypothetical protein